MNKLIVAALLTCLRAAAIPVYGDPADHTAPGGTITSGGVNLDGVVTVFSGTGNCSGALLFTGLHILTAAHCVDQGVQAGDVSIGFQTADGSYSQGISGISVHPDWDPGNEFLGVDLAVLTLTTPSTNVQGYQLYSGVFTPGALIEIAGYGWSGSGVGDQGNYPFGTRRYGLNVYDTTAALFSESPNIWMGDFDNGNSANDAFGGQTGLGQDEVFIAPGDSGGPTFLNGFLAGIHSFVVRLNTPGLPDVDAGPNPNFSFGEMFADISVSGNLTWIEAQMAPEPGTWAMLALGLVGIVTRARARR